MKAVFKRRHDAEVPAAPAQSPEKVRVLGVARGEQSAVGGDDISGESQTAFAATLCPPPRTETNRLCARAKCTSAMTSAAPAQGAISAGRRSIAVL
jgi:hypothetical protein